MSAYPSILNAQALQRLQPPTAAVDPMPAGANPLLSVPPPPLPTVTQGPPPPLTPMQSANTRLLGDQNELQRKVSTGSGISQIQNPLLRGLARTGEIAESILLPGAAALTPGTEFNHQRLIRQDQGHVNSDIANEQQLANVGQTQANTAYLAARPDIEQSKIDERQTAVRDRINQLAASRGQIPKWDPETGLPSFVDDPTSQAYADHQALSAMHQATADKSAITSDIAKNHYIPGTPEFDEAQRKLAQVDKRMQVAMASLGLRAQGLDLRKENTAAALTGIDPHTGQPFAGASNITGDEGQPTTVGSKFAPGAVKQQSAVGSFNDLAGSVSHTRNALNQLYTEGGSLSDPRVVAAMSDPNSLVGKVVNGKLVQGRLSPTEISAINAVRQLHEQAGILRKTTGGTASEAGAQRILDVVPSAGDANAVALSKLMEQEQVLGRLAPGMTHVAGGLSVRPTGQTAPLETKSYQGHTYVKGPQGWHLQQ